MPGPIRRSRTARALLAAGAPFCQTAWAREPGDGGYLGKVRIESFNSNGSLRKAYQAYSGEMWTPMVNDKGIVARACKIQYDNDGGYERVSGATPPAPASTDHGRIAQHGKGPQS